MRVTSKELALVFTCFFSSSCIDKKRSFDKAFDINSWSLAKDYTGKKVNLSFAGYQSSLAVKANRV